MKKIVLVLFCVCWLVSGGYAQTSQGSLMFGGGIRVTTTDLQAVPADQKTTQFQFSPNAGFFVADNFAVGVNATVATTKVELGNATSKNSSFTAGPFARYYMFTANEKFAFTGEAGLNFGGTKSSTTAGGETKGTTMNIYLSPGFTYFLTDHWGLDFQLQGITFTSTDPNKDVDNDKRNTLGVGVSFFSPSLGFRYYIGN